MRLVKIRDEEDYRKSIFSCRSGPHRRDPSDGRGLRQGRALQRARHPAQAGGPPIEIRGACVWCDMRNVAASKMRQENYYFAQGSNTVQKKLHNKPTFSPFRAFIPPTFQHFTVPLLIQTFKLFVYTLQKEANIKWC